MSKWDYSVGADLVSRYVWRGTGYSNSPAFQPALEVLYSNLAIGAWGSYSFNSLDIPEADLYLRYTFWKLKFTCWDYFYMDMSKVRNSYFVYNQEKMGHDFSFDTEFILSEKVPLKVLVSYNFYGADSLHSSYFETSYTLTKRIPLEIFVGFTPSAGWYGNGTGIVNTGVCLIKEYKISDENKMPVYCKLIFNPQRENIYLGITF